MIDGHRGKRLRGAPFGGCKDSGIGSERSIDELIGYTRTKNLNIAY